MTQWNIALGKKSLAFDFRYRYCSVENMNVRSVVKLLTNSPLDAGKFLIFKDFI